MIIMIIIIIIMFQYNTFVQNVENSMVLFMVLWQIAPKICMFFASLT
jgi:hypothetical protein